MQSGSSYTYCKLPWLAITHYIHTNIAGQKKHPARHTRDHSPNKLISCTLLSLHYSQNFDHVAIIVFLTDQTKCQS